MSSETVGQLKIEVTVELARMQAQFDDMTKRVRTLNNKVHSEFRAMGRGIQTIMGAVGLSLAPTALIAYGKSVLDLGSRISDLSAAAGVNSQAFQSLSTHFMDSGVTMEELSKSFVQMRKNINEALTGNKTMQASFAALNLNPLKMQGLAVERQMEALAMAIVNAKDQNAAFGAALDILGTRQAPKLLAALKELGIQGFDKVAEATKKWNLSPEQLKALDDAGDKLERMAKLAQVLSAQGFLAALDALKNNKWVQTAMVGMTLPFGGAGMLAVDAFRQKVSSTPGMTPAEMDAQDAAAAAAAMKNQQTLAGVSGTMVDVETERTERIKRLTAVLADLEKESDRIVQSSIDQNAATRQTNKELDAETEKIKDLAKPWKKYEEQIKRVNDQKRLGRITDDEATAAILELQDLKFAARFGKESEVPIDFDYEQLTTAAKAMQAEMNQLWNSVSDRAGQAFADMVMTGKGAFSDLTGIVARAAIEMVARLAVINPILNMMFGGFSGYGMLPAFFGAGAGTAAAASTTAASSASYAGLFADGGNLKPGEWGIAGEEGPEPIFAGKAGLTVIPNGGMQKGGDTFNFYNHVEAGVTRDELLNSLRVQEQRTIAKISDTRKRG